MSWAYSLSFARFDSTANYTFQEASHVFDLVALEGSFKQRLIDWKLLVVFETTVKRIVGLASAAGVARYLTRSAKEFAIEQSGLIDYENLSSEVFVFLDATVTVIWLCKSFKMATGDICSSELIEQVSSQVSQ